MQTFHKSPRSKGLIWLAWIIAVLSVAMTFAAAWLAHHNNLSGMPTTVRQTVTYYLDELTSPLWAVMGALVIANKPRHANGWMLCAVGLLWSAKQFAGEYAIYSYFSLTTPAPQAAVASWVISWGWFAGFVPMIALFMTLPTGHLLSARWRIPLWIAEFGLSAICLNNAVQVWPLRGRTLFTLTESDLMAHMGPAATVAFPIVLLGSLLLGIAVLLLRFRRAHRVERQQLKWLAYAVALYVGKIVLGGISSMIFASDGAVVSALNGQAGDVVNMIAAAFIPSAIGIAIVRHRLFDIDVVIRKTLQWTLVTLLLGAVYVACVLGLQELFKRVTGQTSEVAVALSTLVLAVAFMPIRRAAQNLIDKRFYRRRYNAEQVIEAYAASIKDEVDTAVIHQKMLDVLGDTLQPKKIVLFLAKPNPHPGPRPLRERGWG